MGKPGREPSVTSASRQAERKKTQAAITPAASTYNITVDTDGLKPQDDTATV